jgi:hypothetical protein
MVKLAILSVRRSRRAASFFCSWSWRKMKTTIEMMPTPSGIHGDIAPSTCSRPRLERPKTIPPKASAEMITEKTSSGA